MPSLPDYAPCEDCGAPCGWLTSCKRFICDRCLGQNKFEHLEHCAGCSDPSSLGQAIQDIDQHTLKA